jgi:GR25 family glycosyltransferase involved in LPS biosynthesis
MKIYIVSCSPARVERLMKAAAPLNLDFEVVDSPLAKDEEVQRRGRRCLERGTGYATGIAATIGHIRAMERIAKRDDPFAIIIEDDVRFHKKFNDYIDMCVDYMKNNTCDILSVGFVNYPRLERTIHIGDLIGCENVGLGSPWGAQCYIITKEYASYFSKLFSIDDLSIPYSGNFVTDCVMFDPAINCKRTTLYHPISVEDPDEQTLAGNNNKPDLFKILRKPDFYF